MPRRRNVRRSNNSDEENSRPEVVGNGASGDVSQMGQVPKEPGKSFHSLNISCINQFSMENDEWAIYKERLEQYFVVNAVEECRKVPVLIAIMGNEAYSFLKDLCFPKLPKNMDFNTICDVMDKHFGSRVAVFRKRIEFHNLVQSSGEGVSEWFAKIKKSVCDCKFGVNLEEFLKDKLVCGLRPGAIQDRLCEEDPSERGLMELLEIALKKESALKSKISERVDGNVFAVNNSKHFSSAQKVPTVVCKVCGKRNHKEINCRFKTYKCRKCNKIGHLASVCRVQINSLDTESDVEPLDLNTIETLRVEKELVVEPIVVRPEIAGIPIEMLLDTGAGVTIVPLSVYRRCFPQLPMERNTVALKAFGGGIIKSDGEVSATVKWMDKTRKCRFLVVPDVTKALLGRDWLKEFDYNFKNIFEVKSEVEDKLQSMLVEFKDLFGEKLGCYKNGRVKLRLKEGAIPKFYKPRPIPFAFKEQVDQQLVELEEQGLIEKIPSSEWGTPLVPVKKPNGKIRICANYKLTVNEFLEDELYPLPRIEELLAVLQGGEKFSKLDFKQAYNQLLLDESSQQILAWSTHKGIYKIKRLPFGTEPAVAIFQKIVEQCLQGLPGVANFLDDVIVTGKDSNEHLENLRNVFLRLKEAGFTLNLEKCEFFKKEVKYLGYKVDANGVKKDLRKVEAIKSMRKPENVSEVRSFIGAVNYYSKFVKNFATILAPIYSLLQKGVPFKWNEECDQAFYQIKQQLLSDQVLTHFNPMLPIRLYCDASKVGVGAVLLHVMPNGDEKPISFASRLLNKAEKNYSMVHKEALAIYWAMKKYYQYLMGQKIEIMCDHKPLLALFGEKKGIPEMAAGRLQRWALYISGFKYELKYISGNKNKADGFSRLPLEVEEPAQYEKDYINLVEGILDVDLTEIKEETQKDSALEKVINLVIEGWPTEITDSQIKPYAQRKEELWVENGVLMWGYRVVMPTKFRKMLLKELHASHQGISKMKTRARSYFWWPLMDGDIEKYVRSCDACSSVRNNPKRLEVKAWPETDRPFQRVHIDYLGPFRGRRFLLLTDAYSKWLEVYEVRNPNSESTIRVLRDVFSRFGLPETIVSDNGTPFISKEFREFCRTNKAKQIFGPPYHPQSNGAAENSVGSFKRGIYKFLNDGGSEGVPLEVAIKRYLFHYRTSVHCTTGDTPAKRMFGRELRTRLDILKKNGPCRMENQEDGRETKEEKERKEHEETSKKKEERRKEHEETSKKKEESKFGVGEDVFIRSYKENQTGRKWERGRVEKVLGDRCYLVKEQCSDTVQKRHADQMLKARR